MNKSDYKKLILVELQNGKTCAEISSLLNIKETFGTWTPEKVKTLSITG